MLTLYGVFLRDPCLSLIRLQISSNDRREARREHGQELPSVKVDTIFKTLLIMTILFGLPNRESSIERSSPSPCSLTLVPSEMQFLHHADKSQNSQEVHRYDSIGDSRTLCRSTVCISSQLCFFKPNIRVTSWFRKTSRSYCNHHKTCIYHKINSVSDVEPLAGLTTSGYYHYHVGFSIMPLLTCKNSINTAAK